MQELRLVAVSEDGTYAVLAVPGRGGRFSLPIDDRLRTVARGQFSRLAQYEIEVENPLRPKEIQDRIRAGETAEEISDAAGIPIDRIRRFEGPVLAEREYRAQEAQRATVRGHTESGPGPRLGEVVLERLTDAGAPADALEWDSRKRTDGNWQVQLQFTIDGSPQTAEWVFDPRRRQVIPADDVAKALCLPESDWPAGRLAGLGGTSATVTPIGSRLGAHHGEARAEPERIAARGAHAAPAAATPPAATPARTAPTHTAPTHSAPTRTAPAHTTQVAPPPPAAQAFPTTASPAATSTARTVAAKTAASAAAAAATAQQAQHAPPLEEPTRGHEASPAADGQPGADDGAQADSAVAETEAPARPGKKSARARRASVPSWDQIMLGNSRQPDQ
jgi:hypothetical protein